MILIKKKLTSSSPEGFIQGRNIQTLFDYKYKSYLPKIHYQKAYLVFIAFSFIAVQYGNF